MSATTTWGNPGFSARVVNTGASTDAKRLENLLGRVLTHYSRRAPRDATLAAVARVYSECRKEGWDGYSAVPLSAGAYHAAVRLIWAIPAAFPMPDVVPEPDGSIAMEWESGRWNALSLSVGEDGRVAYAAMLGKDKREKGSEVFDDVIPQEILAVLWKVTHP
jgi:hypothetical protein